MSQPTSPSIPRTFLSVAGELGLLSPEAIGELATDAEAQQVSASSLALKRGLLDGVKIDIIETLLHPFDAIPGYEILGVLGRGGMGVVYRARQLSLARIVALKMILVSELSSKTAIPRFEQEARAVASLTHPHITAAYDFGQHHGRVYFAMEFVPGEDVERMVNRTGPLDEWTSWGLARQAATGLAHAAEQGIVHRDIKPANMLLIEPPAGFELPAGLPLLKIADFGLARLNESAEDRTRLTIGNAALGSPRYMAPEQFRGETIDLRADMFSLGCSVFHMLAGQPPLDQKTLPQIVAARFGGEVELARGIVPTISVESEELLQAMMHSDRQQRVADYRQLIGRIDDLLARMASNGRVEVKPSSGAASGAATSRMSLEPTTAYLRPGRRVLWYWLCVGLLATSVATLLILPFFIVRPAIGERDLIGAGAMHDLFNGQNVKSWQVVSGGWGPAKNGEGAIVLQGQGAIGRRLDFPSAASPSDTLTHYRLLFLVDLHEASAVEALFDLAEQGTSQDHFVVRLDRESMALGKRYGKSDKTSFVGAAQPFLSPGPLHAVRLERHSRAWLVFVDDQYLGSVPLLPTAEVASFQLVAERGKAWFSDLTCEELKAPSEPVRP